MRKIIFISMCTLILSSCATQPPQSCQELDWYEIGRTDGIKGLKNNERRQVEMTCENSDASLNEAFYNNGFDAGIAQYCTRANGFELAVAETKVSGDTCPLGLGDEFTDGYKAGKRYAALTEQNQNINKRIQDLNQKLNSGISDAIVNGNIKGEKLELESKSQAIEKEMTTLHRSVSNNLNQTE